jgi:ribonuclease HII
VVKGDDLCPSISAAAVLAKVHRDRLMTAYHRQYPQYNFPQHKGYATAEHLEALRCWGPCSIHRRTFSGVKEWVAEQFFPQNEKRKTKNALFSFAFLASLREIYS